MNFPRALFGIFHAVLVLTLASTGGTAFAQVWPTKPIRWVVSFAPGGLADTVSRSAAQQLSIKLGQPIIIENRGGANGSLAASFVAKATADGYTLLTGSTGTHAINPHLYKDLPYDPLKDFVPVAGLVDYELVLVVKPTAKWKTFGDFIADAKARPGALNYGSAGPGASNHMVSEMLGVLAGTRFVHVPFKGDGPSLLALLGDQIDFMFMPISTALPFARDGKLSMLATTGATRSPKTQDVPLAKDMVPQMEFAGWNGIFAPAGTPREIVERIAREMPAILNSPEMAKAMDGVNNAATTPDAFAARLRSEYQFWETIVKRSGARVN